MVASAKTQELASRRARGQPQRTTAVVVPAPQGGINALTGVANQTLSDALLLDNLIPAEYGVTMRKGYREWCEPVPLGDGIKTVMPYSTRTDVTDDSKLFACTSDGIYDVTVPNALPVKVYDWPIKNDRAGWCSWHNFTTLAGPYLLACDLANGYVVYDGTTDTWAPGAIDSDTTPGLIDAADVDFVTVWKNRVWFVERNSGRAWYLPVGQFNGDAKPFEFGNKFRYGGYLKGLYSWTLDGGDGVDDYLVIISDAGDMLVYRGTDPDTVGEFLQTGQYWLGKPPRGRRVATEFGGDLLLASTFGVLLASRLVAGLPLGDVTTAITAKINSRLNTLMSKTLDRFGWEVKLHPADQLVMVLTPLQEGQQHEQYVYHVLTKSWCRFVGVPALTAENWQGRLYIGSADNRLYTYEGYADNVLLEDAGETARAIDWQMLTTFNTYGTPNFKRVQFIRPQFVADQTPSYFVEPRYDFDLSPIGVAPPYASAGASVWDSAIWDTSTWGGGLVALGAPLGAQGIGRHIAVAMRGRATSQVIFIASDVMLDAGGLL